MRSRLLGSQSGFTLLETLIAMAIMLVAFASILMVESASIRTTEKAKQMNIVSMLAKRAMIKTEYEIEGKTFDEVKKEEKGNFEEPFREYGWTRTIKEIKFPELNLNASSEDKTQDSGVTDALNQMTKLVTKYLSDSLREVTVTVHWQKGSGEQSFSVSTYWVNLNHEFATSE